MIRFTLNKGGHTPERYASSAAAAVGGRQTKVGAPCKQVEWKTAHTQ